MQKFAKVNMTAHLAEDIEALEAQIKEIDSEWVLVMKDEVVHEVSCRSRVTVAHRRARCRHKRMNACKLRRLPQSVRSRGMRLRKHA